MVPRVWWLNESCPIMVVEDPDRRAETMTWGKVLNVGISVTVILYLIKQVCLTNLNSSLNFLFDGTQRVHFAFSLGRYLYIVSICTFLGRKVFNYYFTQDTNCMFSLWTERKLKTSFTMGALVCAQACAQ